MEENTKPTEDQLIPVAEEVKEVAAEPAKEDQPPVEPVKEEPITVVEEPVKEEPVPIKDEPAKAEAPIVDPNQKIETNAYVPTYRLKPEFKQAVLKAIGQYPFNQIAGIMNAIQVDVVDHNTFQQIVNVLGNFPYQVVAGILQNINSYVEQIVED